MLLVTFLSLQQVSLCQKTAVLPLKVALQKAKEDTTRLRLHLALAGAGSGQENLIHAEAAVKLAGEILKRTYAKSERKPIMVQQIRAYKRLDTLLFENGKMNPDITLSHAERLLQLNTELGDKKGIAEQQRNLASIKLYKNDTASFLSYLEMSLVNSRQVKDSAGIVNTYQYLSFFYQSTGNFNKVLESLQTGLATAKEMNYKKGIAWCLLQMADIYRDNNEVTQAHIHDPALTSRRQNRSPAADGGRPRLRLGACRWTSPTWPGRACSHWAICVWPMNFSPCWKRPCRSGEKT